MGFFVSVDTVKRVAEARHPRVFSHLAAIEPEPGGDPGDMVLLQHSPNPFRQTSPLWSDGTDESQNIGLKAKDDVRIAVWRQ